MPKKIAKKKKLVIKKLRITSLEQGDFLLLKNSQAIFNYAVDSVSSFYKIYQSGREGSIGSTKHVEQDLLRAMLVFACSGLDAVVKQLIKDALPEIIERDNTGKNAQEEFRKFIERRIKKANRNDKEGEISQIDTDFIAKVLASPNPRGELLGSLQKFLSDNSLQSRDQLLKVAAHFAITTEEILKDFELTKKVFDTRNDIIHEMDVDLSSNRQGQKKRRSRGASDMVKYTETILNVGVCFINAATKKIYGTTQKFSKR